MAKILDDLKDLESSLAELEKEDVSEEENDQDDQEEVTEEELEDEAKEEEDEQEDEQELERKQKEPEEDFTVRKNEYYKMRREKQQLERQLQERTIEKEVDEEYNLEDDLMKEALKEVQIKRALKEFTALEQSFLRESKVEDYDDVVNQYRQSVYQSLRVLNPKSSHEGLMEKTREEILKKASQYYNQGYDPAAELYYEAKELGFGKIKKEAQKEEVKEVKPNHDKIAQNRKRNAGTAAASASGKPEMTAEVAATLSPAEFARLSKEDKDRFMKAM